MENNQYKYIKRLIAALAISGFTNIAVVSVWLYTAFQESPSALFVEQKVLQKKNSVISKLDQSNSDLLRKYRSLSTHQLNMRLYSQKLIENGYTERDLALACLVNLHHFDIRRALISFRDPLQMRNIAFGRRKNGSIATITVYPDLNHAHFQSIIQFAKTERWPYTSEGLFLLLEGSQENKDPSLVATFMQTPEFLACEKLITKGCDTISKQEILSLLLDGGWNSIKSMSEKSNGLSDTSADQRQNFMLGYIEHGSVMACELLLKSDFSFALRKLDNKQIIRILQILPKESSCGKAFAAALLQSPRGDAIWELSSSRIGKVVDEKGSSKHIAETQPSRSAPLTKANDELHVATPSLSNIRCAIPKRDKLYIIEEGDNLWKLSRRYSVSIELLKTHNQLSSDTLKPGTPLRIPLG